MAFAEFFILAAAFLAVAFWLWRRPGRRRSFRILRWTIEEVSAVELPANPDATFPRLYQPPEEGEPCRNRGA